MEIENERNVRKRIHIAGGARTENWTTRARKSKRESREDKSGSVTRRVEEARYRAIFDVLKCRDYVTLNTK